MQPVPDYLYSFMDEHIYFSSTTCTEAGMLSTLAMLQGSRAELQGSRAEAFLKLQTVEYWLD